MGKSKKIILVGILLLLVIGAVGYLFNYNQEGFTGSRIKNPDFYLLDIERMNGTDLHTMELHEDDVLQIHMKTEKGSMYMEMKAPDGTAIYQGNGKEITEFTIKIPENGVYTIVAEANHAKGLIRIQRKEKME
ncbi:MAG: hypothetical protein PUF50_00505 [Erysipelotrichaceae bacterium]|nr:hypothetical protein [Erysipelotrichaceae bacterium]